MVQNLVENFWYLIYWTSKSITNNSVCISSCRIINPGLTISLSTQMWDCLMMYCSNCNEEGRMELGNIKDDFSDLDSNVKFNFQNFNPLNHLIQNYIFTPFNVKMRIVLFMESKPMAVMNIIQKNVCILRKGHILRSENEARFAQLRSH